MNKERLLKLADLLEDDAANPEGVRFDLGGWAKPAEMDWTFGTHYEPLTTPAIKVSCETAACALGLAAISGVFKNEGLTFKITHHGSLVPVYGDYSSFSAANEFFELVGDDAYQLFDPDRYPREVRKGKDAELAVARRIRKLVEENA